MTDQTPNEPTPSAPPPSQQYQGGPPQGYSSGPSRGNGMAVAGMVLGIIGIVFSFIPVIGVFFGSILGLLALILGGVGLSRAKDPSRGGRGQAITGIVLGILALVMVILQVAVIGEAADEFNKELERQQQEQNG